MTLTRLNLLSSGIFGVLKAESSAWYCMTAEHAYPDNELNPTTYTPKLPIGEYTCQRGMHQLEHMIAPFETFEILGVPDHTNILFHVGNYPQIDSSGCVLLGKSNANNIAILESRVAFQEFMILMQGIDSFILTVK